MSQEQPQTNTPTPTEIAPAAVKELSRDEIRAIILGDKAEEKEVQYKSAKVVLRTPAVGEVLDFQAQAQEDRKLATALMVIRYTYVPGTDIKLFDEADVDGILGMPFSQDFQRLIGTINSMLEVSVTGDDKSKAEAESATVDSPEPQ